jgi:hypothetical protein
LLPVAAALGARRAIRAVAAVTVGTLKTVGAAVRAAASVETHRLEIQRTTIGFNHTRIVEIAPAAG